MGSSRGQSARNRKSHPGRYWATVHGLVVWCRIALLKLFESRSAMNPYFMPCAASCIDLRPARGQAACSSQRVKRGTMIFGIDPLMAVGVVIATAATDAVYVLFTSAVIARQARASRHMEQHLVHALLVRRDLGHEQLDLRRVRGGRLMDRCLPYHDVPSRASRATRTIDGNGATPTPLMAPCLSGVAPARCRVVEASHRITATSKAMAVHA